MSVFDDAKKDWLTVLSDLWTAYDKKLNPAQMKIYVRQLDFIPIGLLRKAVDRAILEKKFNTTPSPNEVISALNKELDDPYDLAVAVEDWSRESWKRCVVNFEPPTYGD